MGWRSSCYISMKAAGIVFSGSNRTLCSVLFVSLLRADDCSIPVTRYPLVNTTGNGYFCRKECSRDLFSRFGWYGGQ